MTYVTLSVGYGAAAGGGSRKPHRKAGLDLDEAAPGTVTMRRRYDSLAVADAAIFELRICDPLAFLCLDKLRTLMQKKRSSQCNSAQ